MMSDRSCCYVKLKSEPEIEGTMSLKATPSLKYIFQKLVTNI